MPALWPQAPTACPAPPAPFACRRCRWVREATALRMAPDRVARFLRDTRSAASIEPNVQPQWLEVRRCLLQFPVVLACLVLCAVAGRRVRTGPGVPSGPSTQACGGMPGACNAAVHHVVAPCFPALASHIGAVRHGLPAFVCLPDTNGTIASGASPCFGQLACNSTCFARLT